MSYNGSQLYLCWRSKNRADLKYLIDFTGSREEWSEGIDLSHDAANCPKVYWGVVVSRTKQHLGGSVPGGK